MASIKAIGHVELRLLYSPRDKAWRTPPIVQSLTLGSVRCTRNVLLRYHCRKIQAQINRNNRRLNLPWPRVIHANIFFENKYFHKQSTIF